MLADTRTANTQYPFMACLAIYCTNAINILAGVNGLDVCAQTQE
jgi:UDP-N-acetylmuramyl pentapeptide phosphotransferase/UDP-N-acetylglucosamine-1-phosphate transferase